jgi:hypothetical protein
MRTAINTRLVFEIPAKRRPGKQERRGVWLASRVVAALCRCGEPPLVDHGERSTDYRPFGAACSGSLAMLAAMRRARADRTLSAGLQSYPSGTIVRAYGVRESCSLRW